MLHTEWRIYLTNRRFWFLSLGPLLLAVVSAFSYYAANSVGLVHMTGYTFLVNTVNLYALLFLPFLGVAMGCYLIMAEFNWHTIRRPFIEHVSRQRFIRAKALMAAITLALFMLPYLVLCILLAAVLFGLRPVLVEDQMLSPLGSIVRASAAYLWSGFILYIFVLAGQIVLLRVRNTTVAILSSLLPFYAFVAFGGQLPLRPLRILFQLPGHILEARSLGAGLGQELLAALFSWGVITGLLLWMQGYIFQRQDITTA